jgi:hypothetical protein
VLEASLGDERPGVWIEPARERGAELGFVVVERDGGWQFRIV